MSSKSTILVFGGSGRTGRHFVEIALKKGHKVWALVRDPAQLAIRNSNLEFRLGSIVNGAILDRSEEHKSEIKSLMRISSDFFCFTKKSIHTSTFSMLVR